MSSRRIRHTVLAVAGVLVVAIVGYAAFQYFSLTTGITKSNIIEAPPAAAAGAGAAPRDVNILIMGLDSRVDQNGQPLSPDIYAALHAGDQTDGGLNSNVLMLLHIPGDGSRATEISIPRDDEVALAGCPDKECTGKIKTAYGLADDQESKRIAGDKSLTDVQRQQKSRDAGRKAQIETVQNFLGVHVDHFVEVTMVAFYQLAQVVQPITVCVTQDTQDSFSGADFKAGRQEIDAQQALAFVRQRRDTKNPTQLNFTDLDRGRRQQAFIVSLATQLKQAGTLANPIKLSGILDIVKKNMAIDSGLDLLGFAKQASQMAGGNVNYYTLPVERFDKNARGEDINVVDVAKIQATVKQLLAPQGGATASPSTTATPTPTGTGPTSTGKASSGKSTPSSSKTTAPSTPVTAVPATDAPPPTALSELQGGGIPCVK
ncbi:MAG: LCP family protein [Actinomycetota bacterium]|nr:LCP family protein [Actinomycetota bacterium]